MFVQAESGGGEVDWNELETRHDQCAVQLDRVAEPEFLYGQTEVGHGLERSDSSTPQLTVHPNSSTG